MGAGLEKSVLENFVFLDIVRDGFQEMGTDLFSTGGLWLPIGGRPRYSFYTWQMAYGR